MQKTPERVTINTPDDLPDGMLKECHIGHRYNVNQQNPIHHNTLNGTMVWDN